jgi:hypothetical protein
MANKDWWQEKLRSPERKPLPSSERVMLWLLFLLAAISASAVIAALVS